MRARAGVVLLLAVTVSSLVLLAGERHASTGVDLHQPAARSTSHERVTSAEFSCASADRSAQTLSFLRHCAARPSPAGIEFRDAGGVLPLLLRARHNVRSAHLALVLAPTVAREQRRPWTVFVYAASAARYYTLPLIVERWRGPVSVAVFANASAQPLLDFGDNTGDSATTLHRETTPWLDALCRGLAASTLLHVRAMSPLTILTFVLAHNFPRMARSRLFDAHATDYFAQVFPINMLRNVALLHANYTGAEFVFVTDADMIPSANSSVQVARQVSTIETTLGTQSVAVVVPAFEEADVGDSSSRTLALSCLNTSAADSDMAAHFPPTKDKLRESIAHSFRLGHRTSFRPFRSHVTRDLTAAHAESLEGSGGYAATMHGRWLRGNSVYRVHKAWYRYEPYVAARVGHFPLFNALFYDRSANFASWSHTLRQLDWRFAVQSRVFVVHHPHARGFGDGGKLNWLHRATNALREALWSALRCAARSTDCREAHTIPRSMQATLRNFVSEFQSEVASSSVAQPLLSGQEEFARGALDAASRRVRRRCVEPFCHIDIALEVRRRLVLANFSHFGRKHSVDRP